MQIRYRDREAPLPEEIPTGHRLIRAAGDGSEEKDPKSGFLTAARALGAALATEGASPFHIRTLTIRMPDPAQFESAFDDYDLLYREALSGNSGQVALLPGDGPRLEAQAIVPPTPPGPVFRDFATPALNAQYSPRVSVPEAAEHMAAWRVDGARFQSAHRTVEIPYGPDPKHRLDLFLPDDPVPEMPLHVYIHGGYWQALDKRDNAHLGAALLSDGIAVAHLNYPLTPEDSLTEIVGACETALAVLWAEARTYGCDPGRITVSGHSAGGHLAGMLAATDWLALFEGVPADLIKGTVAISGLFDLEPLRHTGMNAVLRLNEVDCIQLSPVKRPIRSPGPIVAAVGGAESDEFRRQSSDYADAKRAEGFEVRYLELEGLNHFTAAEALAAPDSELFKVCRQVARG
jgi:arylformamidase